MNLFEVEINRAAQGLNSKADTIAWFRSLSSSDKYEALHALAKCAHQSHPRPTDVDVVISESGLKHAYTPCVLLNQGDDLGGLKRVLSRKFKDVSVDVIGCAALFSGRS